MLRSLQDRAELFDLVTGGVVAVLLNPRIGMKTRCSRGYIRASDVT